MMDPSTPSPEAWAAYESFLAQRWPRRIRLLSIVLSVGSVLLLLSDALLVGLGAVPSEHSVLAIAGVRVACLLLPLGGGVAHLLTPSWPHWPRLSVALSATWVFASQWAFYFAGTQRSMAHGVLLFWSVLVVAALLPLRPTARIAYYGFVVASHALLELAMEPDRHLAHRLMGDLAFAVGAASIAWPLERLLGSMRRHFFLKQEMGSAVQTLESSRSQVSEATGTLSELVTKLRDATLELSSESAHARSESERIAQASETVARMAKSASLRAADASNIVAEAAGHTQRIDTVVGRVQNGMSAIGQAIGRTEASLQELETHAEQIVAFTETLQEFATQTDILALNAAMEAARAGEAGRSFAVVAREVRKLAEASKGSSAKINQVVRGIREQLDSTLRGMSAVRESTRQFESTFADARKTLEAIREIVTHIEEVMLSNVEDANDQANATGSISTGSARLKSLVNTHAQMSEDVALTADRLGRLADELRALLPLKEQKPEDPAPVTPPPAQAPPTQQPREAIA